MPLYFSGHHCRRFTKQSVNRGKHPLKIRTKPNAVVLRIFVSAPTSCCLYPPQWVNNSKSVLLLPLLWAKASAIVLQKQYAIGLIASVSHNYHLYRASTRSQKWVVFSPYHKRTKFRYRNGSIGLANPYSSCSIDGVQNTNEMNAVHTELVVRCLH